MAYKKGISTIRTATYRMTLHKDGFVELYDHTTVENETKNIADKYPEIVKELKDVLKSKMQYNTALQNK